MELSYEEILSFRQTHYKCESSPTIYVILLGIVTDTEAYFPGT
jgi:hypothetical protein